MLRVRQCPPVLLPAGPQTRKHLDILCPSGSFRAINYDSARAWLGLAWPSCPSPLALLARALATSLRRSPLRPCSLRAARDGRLALASPHALVHSTFVYILHYPLCFPGTRAETMLRGAAYYHSRWPWHNKTNDAFWQGAPYCVRRPSRCPLRAAPTALQPPR